MLLTLLAHYSRFGFLFVHLHVLSLWHGCDWLQGSYLVHGEQKREGGLTECGGSSTLHNYETDLGGKPQQQQHQQAYLRSSRSQLRGGSGRGLSRQDTFDSETQGSRDSAYTEAGDSCMDIETDPYEEPDPYRGGGGSRLHLAQHHGRQASWEDEGAEPDQENLNHPPMPSQMQPHGRAKLRERYCQDPVDTGANMSRNKNQDDWGKDVYIRWKLTIETGKMQTEGRGRGKDSGWKGNEVWVWGHSCQAFKNVFTSQ